MIAIIDYGAGKLFSLYNALSKVTSTEVSLKRQDNA